MKPRSKRNRKRPRSAVNALNKEATYETSIRQLELDGKTIAGTHKWLRLIKPYPYTYSTYAKGRWEGREIIDVYSTEFGSYPKSYYETAIRQGRILVSDKKVSTSYIVKGGDVLSHTVHRHEPGVAVQSNVEPYVKIINETDELVVVSKPGTMPVHPCGGYSMQSLMNILEKYYTGKSAKESDDANKLYTIHRLDRLTSGLVIIGKTSGVAQSYSKCIMNRSCQKVYLARVAGKFPLKYKHLKILCSKEVTEADLPLHGEWKGETSVRQSSPDQSAGVNSNDKSISSEASRLRKQYALACWVANEVGRPVFEDERDSNKNLLERVFQSRHSVDDWLSSMDQSNAKNTEDVKLWLHLACPTRIAKHKDGICEAGSFDDLDDALYVKSVKPAHSAFGVVSYDEKSDSTLLICRPYTGRTHQLRLHLQHLEHPIANDPNYGGDIWYANPEGRRACQIAQDRLSIINNGGDISFSNANVDGTLDRDPKKLKSDKVTPECEASTSAIDVPATETEIQEQICKTAREKEESIHDFIERTCVWCARCRSVPSADRAVLEFVIRSPGIWLHALQYSFPVESSSNDGGESGEQDIIKSFRADLPEWHEF